MNLNNIQNASNLKNINNLSNLPMPLPLPLQSMVANTNDPQNQMKSLNQMAPVILNPADAFKALAQVMPFSGGGGGIPSAAMPPPMPLQSLQRNNSCGNLMDLQSSLKEKSLQEQLEKEQKKTQIIQTAYWSLRSDYQSVCRALKAEKKNKAAKPAAAAAPTFAKSPKNGKSKLNTIAEGESSDVKDLKDDFEEKLREKEAVWSQKQMAKNAELANLRQKNAELLLELKALRKNNQQAVTTLKQKNKEVNKKNNTLEMYIKNLKMSIKKLERENKKLANNKSMKKDILSELYLSSNRIKQLMAGIKGYGGQIQALRKRQLNLTASIGRDDEETVKTRMNELYCDVVKAEESYNTIYQSLDIIKKNKEYIALLEKEKFVQSSHLEEYVKENQKLQLDLRDREMKLRQTQSKFNRIKQRLNRLQNENDSLCDQLNQMEAGGPMEQGPMGGPFNGGNMNMMPPNGQFMHNPYFNGPICAQ